MCVISSKNWFHGVLLLIISGLHEWTPAISSFLCLWKMTSLRIVYSLAPRPFPMKILMSMLYPSIDLPLILTRAQYNTPGS
jgi:hypothetical protein